MKKTMSYLAFLCTVVASLCYGQEECLIVSTHRIDLGTQPGCETFSASFVVYRSGCFPTRDVSLSVQIQENENWIWTISPEAFTIDHAFGQTTVRFSGGFPYTAGRFAGTIIVTGDTPFSPQEREEIEVFGIVEGPRLQVSPAKIELGTQTEGAELSRSITIKNAGGGILTGQVSASTNWITNLLFNDFTLRCNDPWHGERVLEFDIKVPWGEDIPGNGSQFNGTIKIDWTNADGHSKRDSVTISGSVNDGACSNEDELVLSHYPLHVPFRPGSKWQVGGMGSFYGEGYHKRRSYYATDWYLSAGADLGEAVYPVAPGRVVAVRSGCDNCIVDQNQNGQQDDNEPCEWNYWDDNGCAICYRTNARFDDSYNVFSFWPHGDFSAGLGNYVAVEHRFGMTSVYGHLHEVVVEPGEEVFVDTKIGTIGNNGCSWGSHLHLALWRHTRGVYECFCAPSPMIARDSLWVLTDGGTATVAPKSLFLDVPQNFWAKLWIDAIIASGIIQRDQEDIRYFDPYRRILRSEMARYLLRGKFGRGYDASKDIPHPAGIFADVPPSHPDAAWIEKLYLENMTAGCSSDPLRYCPNQYLTRAEMAVFLLRALHQSSYVPPAPSRQTFVDVPLDHWAAEWVEQLWQEGITGGCGETPRKFCPDDYVTRAEIAVFLLRAFKKHPPARDQEGFGLLGGPEVAVSVETPEEIAQLPCQPVLLQNYPNPFNPGTSIEFVLPRASFVTLKIYDALGKEVATLVAEKLPAGQHERVWEAKGVASGMYVCRIEAGDFVQTKKLMLVR
ncbi:hypothetical protein DCC62_26270 [candidate division KSB1 bacterium]|nr:MAG: hypothetical protein DCC62_26270 [candidate division KSB1 bacterium]